MKKPLSRVGNPTVSAGIGDADDYAEEAASPVHRLARPDDDDEICDSFTPAHRAHDGGHVCYVISVSVRQLHRLLRSRAVRLDPSIERRLDPAKKRERIDGWAKGLLSDRKPFLGQLTWNVRPQDGGHVEYIRQTHTLKISGIIYMPDSFHRHEAFAKAYEAIELGGNFDPRYRVGICVHHLGREEEARLSADLNQPRTAAGATRVYALHPRGALLARLFVERSPHLGSANVEQVRTTLSAKNPRLMAFTTLVRALEAYWLDATGTSDETREKHVEYLTAFWDALVNVRPELGVMHLPDRARVRRELVVDSAAAIGTYIHVAARLYPHTDFSLLGHLRDKVPGTSLDFFSRQNPIWTEVGLLVPAVARGSRRVLNLRNAKEPYAAMRQVVTALLGLDPSTTTVVA